MKKQIVSFISGAMIFGSVGVFAGQYVAHDNPFPIQLNGKNVSMQGYNIEGSTYFKLRDIADVVGGFEVDFCDGVIQLSKDGYKYDNSAQEKENAISGLKNYAKRIDHLYYDVCDATFNEVKFMLTDVSGDEIPELLAVGKKEGAIWYMEVFQYNAGRITKIENGQCGGLMPGGYIYPVQYKGRTYILAQNISSATGFYQTLNLYEGNEWVEKTESYIQYNWDNVKGDTRYVINDRFVSEAEFDAHQKEVESGGYAEWEFVTANEL